MNSDYQNVDSLAWTKLFPFAVLRLGGLPVSVLKAFRSLDLEKARLEVMGAQKDLNRTHDLLLEELDSSLNSAPAGYLRTVLYNTRKRFFQKKNVLWERILWDLNAIDDVWSTRLTQLIHEYEQAESQYKSACVLLENNYDSALQNAMAILPEIMDENFLNGLCSSSKSLTKRAISIRKNKLLITRKKDRQTALGLWQNIARVATKTSPRGTWGPVSVLNLEQNKSPRVLCEKKSIFAPNVALLDLIYGLLSEASNFHLLHPIRLNPSLEKATDGSFRFLAYAHGVEQVQVLEQDEVLDFLYETIKEPMLYKRVAKRIVKITSTPKLECMHYVQHLIDFGFFVWEKPELGLSVDWAKNLANHIASLVEHPGHRMTVDFLSHLDKQSKILGNTIAVERLKILTEGQQKLTEFADFFEVDLEGLSAEALWYEDSLITTNVGLELNQFKKIINSLSAEIQFFWRFSLSNKQRKALLFFNEKYTEDTEPTILEFLHLLLQSEKNKKLEDGETGKGMSVNSVPLGAVLQIYKNDSGLCQAVLNGLHIGGGKLMNRFLPMFPNAMQKTMADWLSLETEVCWTEMAWHSSFNANFRPSLETCVLDIPEGKNASQATEYIPLSELFVRLNPTYKDHLELVWDKTGMVVRFLDTIPESPAGLPPMIQYLRALGMPYFSKSIFEKKYPIKFEKTHSGWLHSKRQYLDEEELIVLRRATWYLPVATLKNKVGSAFFQHLRILFKENKLPDQVYFKVANAKPQYLDSLNPLSVLFFEKYLKKVDSEVALEECLPIPESSLFETENGSTVGELAIELRI